MLIVFDVGRRVTDSSYVRALLIGLHPGDAETLAGINLRRNEQVAAFLQVRLAGSLSLLELSYHLPPSLCDSKQVIAEQITDFFFSNSV